MLKKLFQKPITDTVIAIIPETTKKKKKKKKKNSSPNSKRQIKQKMFTQIKLKLLTEAAQMGISSSRRRRNEAVSERDASLREREKGAVRH